MSANWNSKDQRCKKISQSLRERAIKGDLPWQIAAKERQLEYDSTPKICKFCGNTYYKAWTKSGKSDFCSQKCSRAYSTHSSREEINKKVSLALQGISTKSGGKINVLEDYIKNPKCCLICGEKLPYEKRKRNTCSERCAELLRIKSNRERGTYEKTGGYRDGSSRSKSGYYKGFFCGSTYELVYYIYCIDHGIKIERNTKAFPYEWEGKSHNYLPDFRTEDGLVEIKGYGNKLVDVKLNSVDEPIKILYYKDIEYMMDYIDEKYGVYHKGKQNNYYTLYDEYKPTYNYVCSQCGKEFGRDKEIKTDLKFCSRSCSGSYSHQRHYEFVDKSIVHSNSVPVPNYDGFMFSLDNQLYSNKLKNKDGNYLKCKLMSEPTGRNVYMIGRKKFTIDKLRKMCGYK